MLLFIQLVLGVIAIARGWEWWRMLLIFPGMFVLGMVLAVMGFSNEIIAFADVMLTAVLAWLAIIPPQKVAR